MRSSAHPKLRTVAIEGVGAGTLVLVAEGSVSARERVIVTSYLVVLDAAGTYKFTATTPRDLSGAIPASCAPGIGSEAAPLLIGDGGEGLSIVTTGAGPHGHLTYYLDG